MSDDGIKWHKVASVSQVTEDEPLPVKVGETEIGLYLVDGEIRALSNICSHEFAILTDGFVEGNLIECPLHQAQFDICTGKAMSPPADEDVPIYPVKLDGDDVYVGLTEVQAR